MPRSKEFNEAEVLEKAMELFWKKGYHNTSIKDLIEFLGISNASIYNAYGGKRTLFDQTLAHYQKVHGEGMRSFLESQPDVRVGLRSIFEKIIMEDQNDVDCKGCFIVNTTTEMIPADSELKKILASHQLKMESSFLEYLETGVKAGQISGNIDLQMMSKLLYTLMTGLRVTGKALPNVKASLASVDAVLSLLG